MFCRSWMVVVHYRNFDVLRLIAAASVVFSHSFLIATGSEATEPLHFTGQVTGVYGVFVFFILSGFLVTESARRSSSLCEFARKRFLRIYPALVVSVLVVTYLMAPLFDRNGAWAFATDSYVFERVVDLLTFRATNFHFDNVVFYPAEPGAEWLPGLVNGVLWTIRLEVTGYCLIALMAAIGLFAAQRQLVLVLVLVVLTAVAIIAKPMSTQFLSELFFVLPSFLCGIFMNWLVQHHRPNGWAALACAVGIVLLAPSGLLPALFPFLVAYPVIWLGAATFIPLPRFYEGTDISYGVYLYGWPVTQLIRHFVGPDLNGYQMAAIALPATMLVALASWLLVEKPALRFKTRRPAPQPATVDAPAPEPPPIGQSATNG